MNRTFLKYLICTLVIMLMLVNADPSSLYHAIIGANLYFLLLVVLLYVLNLIVKSYRWGILVRSSGEKVPFGSIFTNFVFAQAINNITPGRVAGEATRIYGVNAQKGVRIGVGTASVFTERLMDLVLTTIIALTGVILLSPLLMPGVLDQLYIIIGMAVIANLAIIYLLVRPMLLRGIADKLIRLIIKVSPGRRGRNLSSKLSGFIDSFTDAMAPSKGQKKKVILGASALTVIIWANEIARVGLIMMALGSPVNFAAIMVVTSLTALSGIFLIAGSSNIFVSSAVFSAAGVDAGIAAGAGVLSALTSIWLSVPIGLLAMLLGDHNTPNDRAKVELQVEKEIR